MVPTCSMQGCHKPSMNKKHSICEIQQSQVPQSKARLYLLHGHIPLGADTNAQDILEKKKQSLSQTQFNRKLICYKILINYQILPRGRTRSGLRGSRRRGRTRRPPRCLCCEIRKARNQTGFSNILCVFKKHKKETIALMTNSFKMLFSRSQHECF